MGEAISPDAILAALSLPASAIRPQRVPKAALLDGVAQAADRTLLETRIERLHWLATLSPASIGVPAFSDEARDVPAIQLLRLDTRPGGRPGGRPGANGEPGARLPLLIHRAIPVPVILLTTWPGQEDKGSAVRLTLAPLRRAERVEARVVERMVAAPDLGGAGEAEGAEGASAAFLASLALSMLPRGNLHDLYEGLVARAEALAAARASGTPFRLLADAGDVEARREGLAAWSEATAEAERLAAAARAEKKLARAVALGEAARTARTRAQGLAAALASTCTGPAAGTGSIK